MYHSLSVSLNIQWIVFRVWLNIPLLQYHVSIKVNLSALGHQTWKVLFKVTYIFHSIHISITYKTLSFSSVLPRLGSWICRNVMCAGQGTRLVFIILLHIRHINKKGRHLQPSNETFRHQKSYNKRIIAFVHTILNTNWD